jgi:hypothetical protein
VNSQPRHGLEVLAIARNQREPVAERGGRDERIGLRLAMSLLSRVVSAWTARTSSNSRRSSRSRSSGYSST